ncbi:MAG: PAS domain-containing protein [Candidatus Kapabacteria bacterium]|nr:PAS domain-containing protein [Candidatus Kapabacteria bacterium]
MADSIEELKSKLEILTKDKEELKSKLDAHVELLDETLQHSDTVIVDCTEDFRINAVLGPYDQVFHEHRDKFKHGGNLMKIVYATTKNIIDQDELKQHSNTNEAKNLEQKIIEFMQSKRNDILLKVVGETTKGETFILIWNMKRFGRYFRSFFTSISANIILDKISEKHEHEIEVLTRRIENLVEYSSDGFIILDKVGKITFISRNARKTLMAQNVKRLMDADVRGRLYREIFVNDSIEEINRKLDINKRVFTTNQAESFIKKSPDGDIHFSVFPDHNEFGDVQGIVIVTSLKPTMISNELEQKVKRLSTAVQKMQSEKTYADERIKELDYNQQWMMKKMEESNQNIKLLHKSLKQLYNYLENLPIPICIIDLPTLKYEFVNTKMHQWMNTKKTDVVGKRDEELLEKDLIIALNEIFKETIKTMQPIKISYKEYTILQMAFSNEKNLPTRMIRLIY